MLATVITSVFVKELLNKKKILFKVSKLLNIKFHKII